MLLKSDPPIFLEQSDDTLYNTRSTQKFNAEIYERLLKIEFNLAHISELDGTEGVVPVRDELVRKLHSNNAELKKEILDRIRNSDEVLDLNYSDAEDPELDGIDGYTIPKPNSALLKIAGIYEDVILILAQKLVDYFHSNRVHEAEELLSKNKTLVLELYKLPATEHRNRLIDYVLFGACKHADLLSLSEFQRQFILGVAGIYGLFHKKFDLAWIQSQSHTTLEFIGNIDVLGNAIKKHLPLQRVTRVFQKFGKRNALALFKYGVDTENELVAFEELSPSQFNGLVRMAKCGDLDSQNLNKIDIINNLKKDSNYFNSIYVDRVAQYIQDLGEEYQELLNNTDTMTYLYFTSPPTIQLINAIGLIHTRSLYVNHFETFSALYSQGEWFLCNYRSIVRNLINMHLDDRLFPQTHTEVAQSQRIEFHKQIKLLKDNNDIPQPPPRTNSLRAESYEAGFSSSSSSFER